MRNHNESYSVDYATASSMRVSINRNVKEITHLAKQLKFIIS